MRYRVYAIVYLFILVFYLISPVIPYIHYAVFKEYIARNLCVKKDLPNNCCHGKCYLEKHVKNIKETGENEEKNTDRKAERKTLNEFLPVYISFSDLFAAGVLRILKIELISIPCFVSDIFVPPEIKSKR
jgi:hypothetical protein